jgi:hypothetical protein
MKDDASTFPIVLPWWEPSLGCLAGETVGMVPASPWVVGLNIELRVTPFAGPKEGRGRQSLFEGILEPVHAVSRDGGDVEKGG